MAGDYPYKTFSTKNSPAFHGTDQSDAQLPAKANYFELMREQLGLAFPFVICKLT
jgi:hypothetical protein